MKNRNETVLITKEALSHIRTLCRMAFFSDNLKSHQKFRGAEWYANEIMLSLSWPKEAGPCPECHGSGTLNDPYRDRSDDPQMDDCEVCFGIGRKWEF